MIDNKELAYEAKKVKARKEAEARNEKAEAKKKVSHAEREEDQAAPRTREPMQAGNELAYMLALGAELGITPDETHPHGAVYSVIQAVAKAMPGDAGIKQYLTTLSQGR